MLSICGVVSLKVDTQIKMKLKWFITFRMGYLFKFNEIGCSEKNLNIIEIIIEGGSYR